MAATRSLLAAGLMLAMFALLAGGCGDDDEGSGVVAESPTSAGGPSVPDDPRLPFDFGPGIVLGGDDVVGEIDVDVDGRFIDDIAERPDAASAEVFRWVADDAQASQVRAAINELAGDEDVDMHLDPGRFAFDIGGHHDHGGAPDTTETTVAPATPPDAPDLSADDAVARTLAFIDDAGFTPADTDARTFDVGGSLAVEVDLSLIDESTVPDTTVIDAVASLTFDGDGHIVGGYGPLGRPELDRTVAVIDVDTAIRRLALVSTLSGYPTTTMSPPGPTTLVSAELVLALRDVVDATGLPVGEQWLLPTYRFTDAAGDTHTVTAVVASQLRLS